MPWLAALLLFLSGAAVAGDCRSMVFEDVPMTVCEVSRGEDLRLFRAGPDGNYGSFNAVNEALAAKGLTLGFAMNAGMYHSDRSPVGLYVEESVEAAPIVTRAGPGNFGMLPNGVFCIGDSFSIFESRQYSRARPDCRFATQSGPMLVIGGRLHPRFIADSNSVFIRNGVGVTADGTRAFFAISDSPVNFHRFARFFRDALRTPDALYFDGNISRLYAPQLGRHDAGFPMGPIVGTVISKG